jgi:pyrimidine-specific ribonucleoside hydrolase
MQRRGFSPFDALAVAYAARPDLLSCREMRARIGFSVFLAPFGLGRDLEVVESGNGTAVRYCATAEARVKPMLLERLSAASAP